MKGIMIIVLPLAIIIAGLIARLLLAWLLASLFKALMVVVIMFTANLYGMWELGALLVLVVSGAGWLFASLGVMLVGHRAIEGVVADRTGKSELQHLSKICRYLTFKRRASK